MIIEEVRNWLSENRYSIRSKGIEIEIHIIENVSNESLRIDFSSIKSLGRVVLWLSQDCNFEVISVDSEDIVFSKNLVIKSMGDWEQTFKEFIEAFLA